MRADPVLAPRGDAGDGPADRGGSNMSHVKRSPATPGTPAPAPESFDRFVLYRPEDTSPEGVPANTAEGT